MGIQDIRTSVTLQNNTTAGDVRDWLDNIPRNARLTVEVTKGDRPFDSGEERIIARWVQPMDKVVE